MLVFSPVSFVELPMLAERPTSGAQAVDQCNADFIAGFGAVELSVFWLPKAVPLPVADCARDMRSYTFWARNLLPQNA